MENTNETGPLPYWIVVDWSEKDRAYVARVPGLGTRATQAATPEDAVRLAHVAALEEIEAHQGPGLPTLRDLQQMRPTGPDGRIFIGRGQVGFRNARRHRAMTLGTAMSDDNEDIQGRALLLSNGAWRELELKAAEREVSVDRLVRTLIADYLYTVQYWTSTNSDVPEAMAPTPVQNANTEANDDTPPDPGDFHEDLRIGIGEALAGRTISAKESLLRLGFDPADLAEFDDDSNED